MRQFESELSLRSLASLFPIKEGSFENPPVLPYRCSKINPSFFFDKAGCTRQFESKLSLRSLAQLFPLKGGSTAFPKPLSPQGTGDVPTALLGAQTASLYGWRTIRGLRQQRSCSFLCGDEPAFTQGFAKGLLAA